MIRPQAARQAARRHWARRPPAARRPKCAVKWDRNLKPKLAIMRQCMFRHRQTDWHHGISARCNIYIYIYIPRCQCPSVCPSLCLWGKRIGAYLRFKFRSKFTAHCRRGQGSSQQQHIALCQPLLGPLVLSVSVALQVQRRCRLIVVINIWFSSNVAACFFNWLSHKVRALELYTPI